METDIYMGRKFDNPKERVFIFIPKGSLLDSLPADAVQNIGELTYQKSINIMAGEKRIALDTDEAIQHIQDKGYYIQGTKIRTHMS